MIGLERWINIKNKKIFQKILLYCSRGAKEEPRKINIEKSILLVNMVLIIYYHICLVQLVEDKLRDLKRDTSKNKVGELYREILENEIQTYSK